MARATLAACLAAGLLAACAAPFQLGGSDFPGDKNLGALRVGSYNYVAACQAFRQEDYTSIAGAEPPDWQVGTTFASRTYGDQDPYRAYRSECRHLGLIVAIGQFPTPDQYRRGLRAIHGQHDTAVSDALGLDRDTVFVDTDTGTISVEADNKVVSATSRTPLHDVTKADITKATRLMKLVLRRVRDLAAHPAGPLDVTRPGAAVAGHPYLSACRVLLPADYAQVLGQPADEGAIEAGVPVADVPPATYVKQENSCRIGNLPERAVRSPSVEQAMRVFEVVTTHAEVTVSQLGTPADAAGQLREGDGRPVPGLGDQAVYVDHRNAAGDQVRYLKVRRGTNVAEFRVTHDTTGKSDPEGLDTLRRLAAVCVPRMG
jgi:hypothetical protein